MKNKWIIGSVIIVFMVLILINFYNKQDFEVKATRYNIFLVKEYRVQSFSIDSINNAFKEIDELKISSGAIGFFRVINKTDSETIFEAGFYYPKPKEINHPGFKVLELNHQMVASMTIKGSYSRIKNAYKDLYEWVQTNNLTPDGAPYELYFNSPKEVATEHLKTQILFPVLKND